MSSKPPNELQKLVRGLIRDLITQANEKGQEKDKHRSSKAQEVEARQATTSSKVATTRAGRKRSRHIPAKVRVSVLHRDGYKCVFCGRSAGKVELEVDHIKPFSQGGSNNLSNLQTLCFDCNRGKGSRQLM